MCQTGMTTPPPTCPMAQTVYGIFCPAHLGPVGKGTASCGKTMEQKKQLNKIFDNNISGTNRTHICTPEGRREGGGRTLIPTHSLQSPLSKSSSVNPNDYPMFVFRGKKIFFTLPNFCPSLQILAIKSGPKFVLGFKSSRTVPLQR